MSITESSSCIVGLTGRPEWKSGQGEGRHPSWPPLTQFEFESIAKLVLSLRRATRERIPGADSIDFNEISIVFCGAQADFH